MINTVDKKSYGYAGLVWTLHILPNSSLSQCSEVGHHRVVCFNDRLYRGTRNKPDFSAWRQPSADAPERGQCKFARIHVIGSV